MNRFTLLGLAFVLALGCSQPQREDATQAQKSAPPATPALTVASATSGPAASASAESIWATTDDEVPTAKFDDGARAFAKVKETLLRNYYAEGVSEDDLYRAATAGMLEKLEPKMRKWNRLLAPREVAEMRNDLKGEVVGIGVTIQFDDATGHAVVTGSFPGSPAAKAGLVAGDTIVTVNGKLYKGMRLKDVVGDIRGNAGENVVLSVLRDAKLIDVTIKRERVTYDQPNAVLLPDGVGYVAVPSFTDKTPGAVRAALDEFAAKGAKALIVDLRHCPGGSFERALETSELFLAEGTPIVTLRRCGGAEEKHVAHGKPVLVDVPIAVLVDGSTTSGGEFFTAALREGRHARVVGQRTMGKWSVQSVDDLPNGYAYKYTVSLFFTPSGKSFEGEGLTPDVTVALDEAALARARLSARPEDRLALDPQLRTAKELVAPAPR